MSLHPAVIVVAPFLFAGFAQLIELFMTGMGHGWSSPVETSPWNYLFALLFGILVFLRRRSRQRLVTEVRTLRIVYYLLVLACGLILAAKDIGIVTRTNEEGWYYAQRTFEAMQAAFANVDKRHSLGAANSLELTTAKTNFDNAENDLINARYDYLFRLKILDFYQGKELRL